MRRLFFTFGFLMCVIIGMSAYKYNWERAPKGYLAKQTALVNSATSVCNTDGESFNDFRKKWNQSVAFRKERMAYTGNSFPGDSEQEWRDMTKNYLDWTTELKVVAKARRRVGCCTSYSTYFDVSTSVVGWKSEESCTCGESGGGCTTLLFERIDGKWYLTMMLIAG